jgi:2-dehydro-3-deoxyphosphogluconate aldolase/(4S)-4-hydroxy-2-oxoglutarate aldolase
VLSVEQAFPTRLAGVIRTDDPELAFRACMAALEGGIGTVEVTLTVPTAFQVVRGLKAAVGPAIPVGVGTVWDSDSVRDARDAGADFVVTPAVLPDVAAACRRAEVLCVLGALTPTEIHQARTAGAQLVKVFPIANVGGPDYVRSLMGPMPEVPLWVSGGVRLADVETYLNLGVRAIGLTGELFTPEAMTRQDFAEIKARARRAVASAGAVTAG